MAQAGRRPGAHPRERRARASSPGAQRTSSRTSSRRPTMLATLRCRSGAGARAFAGAGRTARLAPSSRSMPVPIHGAFRFTQLLSYRDRLALVDFDGFEQGHPMCDVGSFVAHLYYLLRQGRDWTRRRRSAAARRRSSSAYRAADALGHAGARPCSWYTAGHPGGEARAEVRQAPEGRRRREDRVTCSSLAEGLLDGRLTLADRVVTPIRRAACSPPRNIPTRRPRCRSWRRVASEDAMATLFAAHLAPGWTLRRCRIQRSALLSGPRLSVGLQPARLRRATGEAAVLSLLARAFGDEPVPEAFRAAPPTRDAGRAGCRASCRNLGLALWTFPDDPGVLGLADVWRRGGATVRSRRRAGARAVDRDRRPGSETVLVSYVPAKRCILRYDRLDHARPEPFYGKVYANDDAAVLLRPNADRCGTSRNAHAPELRSGATAGLRRASQRALAGVAGRRTAARDARWARCPGALATCRGGARGAAPLPLQPERRWRLEEETAKLRPGARRAGPLPSRIAVPRSIASSATCWPRRPVNRTRLVPVHGDFHCNQVLVQEERVADHRFRPVRTWAIRCTTSARFLSRFRALRARQAERRSSDRSAAAPSCRRTRSWCRGGWIAAGSGGSMAALLVNRQALEIGEEACRPAAASRWRCCSRRRTTCGGGRHDSRCTRRSIRARCRPRRQ